MSYTFINCANMGASGILVRGKKVTDEFQLHTTGCQDEKAMKKTFGRYAADAFEVYETIEAARVEFNNDLGEMGWDFDQHVTIKPCVKK